MPRSTSKVSGLLKAAGVSVIPPTVSADFVFLASQSRRRLWRRIIFILISNTDDHLRNHRFLWAGPAGWRLKLV